MRVVVLIAWLAVMAAFLLSLPFMPDQVGDPDEQMGKFAYAAAMMGGCSFIVWIVPLLLPPIARRAPWAVNMPYRLYWLAPERREASLTRLLSAMRWMSLWVLGIFACLHGGLLWQMHPEWPPLPDWLTSAGLIGMFLLFLAWMIWLYRLFPAPAKA